MPQWMTLEDNEDQQISIYFFKGTATHRSIVIKKIGEKLLGTVSYSLFFGGV